MADSPQTLSAAVDGLFRDREAAVARMAPERFAAIVEASRCRANRLIAVHTLHGEARAEALFDFLLAERAANVAELIPANIRAVVRQYALAGRRGLVDRAVFHEDGRATLVEVKDAGPLRDIVAGIGQVVLYRALMERTTSFSPIAGVLAVLHDHDDDVARACEIAGVGYLPLGNVAVVRIFSQLAAVLWGGA